MNINETVTSLITHLLEDKVADEVYELIEKLDADEDNRQFCEQFNLGEGIIELMDLNDISILSELDMIASVKLQDEADNRAEAKLNLHLQNGEY